MMENGNLGRKQKAKKKHKIRTNWKPVNIPIPRRFQEGEVHKPVVETITRSCLKLSQPVRSPTDFSELISIAAGKPYTSSRWPSILSLRNMNLLLLLLLLLLRLD